MHRRDFLKFSAITTASLSSITTAADRLPPDGEKTALPNILFCIADDASYPHMGAYGCDWVETPAFDRVAHEGILFTRAYTPNAKCAPSRSCVLTGRNSWQLEQAANHWPHFPDKFKTFPETLAENGYHVGFTGKGWAPGVVGKINGQQRQLCGKPYHQKRMTPPAGGISSCDYAANFSQFLEGKPSGKPFMFWYGGHEPHRGYEFKVGIKKGGKCISDIKKVPSFWPDNETVRADMLDYAYEIEYFDKHLQRMLETLEESGQLDNTLVVITADNGMPFPRVKGQEYEYSNHLPLAMMWKNGIKKPGRVIDDFVNFIDFAPTFLELAKIDAVDKGMQEIQGKSLTPLFYSTQSGLIDTSRDYVLIGKERHDVGRPHDWGYPIRGIVKGDFLYIHNFQPDRWPAGNPETGYLNCDGSPTKTECLKVRKTQEAEKYWQMSFGKRVPEELYHIGSDPECITNLAGNSKYEDVEKQLKKQLFEELKLQGDPRILRDGKIFDEYEYANPSGRNFYERYMRGEKLDWGWVNKTDFEKEL